MSNVRQAENSIDLKTFELEMRVNILSVFCRIGNHKHDMYDLQP